MTPMAWKWFVLAGLNPPMAIATAYAVFKLPVSVSSAVKLL